MSWNFEVKQQVFISISIVMQKCQFCAKKIELLGEMLTFSWSVQYYWKWLSFCKKCLFLENCDFLCGWFIYINKVSNSDQKFNFLGYVNF